MAFPTITGPVSEAGSGVFPTLVFVQGNEQRTINLDHTPFSVGRKVDKDLVIADPRVSCDHALIVSENGQFCVIDQSSKHGRPGSPRNDARSRGGLRETGAADRATHSRGSRGVVSRRLVRRRLQGADVFGSDAVGVPQRG